MADDLRAILKSLSPRLNDGKYSVGTFSEAQMMGLAKYMPQIFCIFREKEGLTVVFSSDVESDMQLYTEKNIQGPFALITLDVLSSLMSVGLLGRVTGELAKEKIACNAFSAYHHDHLLVPYDKRDAALSVLKKIQKTA